MRIILSSITVSVCVSCGGGGDGIEGSGLNGTVAIGKPLINSEITIKGQSGNKVTVFTGSDGKYQANVSSLTAPYILKANSDEYNDLYTIATEAGTANIHPLTDTVSRNWFSNKNRSIENEFDSDNALINPPTKTEVDNISQSINNLLAVSYEKYEITKNFNFIKSSFDANNVGFDLLLDISIVQIINNKLIIKLVEPEIKLENTLIEFNLDQLLSTQDNQQPTKPQGLQSFSNSATSLLVLWNPAQDNVGVSGYNVYRDDAVISQTPFPLFSDTDLVTNTTFCYTIEAIDGSGNTSELSEPLCVMPQTPTQIDAPLPPDNLLVSSNGDDSIALQWQASSEAQVLGYHIYRVSNQSENTKIATQTNNIFQDSNLSPNSEYCYQVAAFNIEGVESVLSETSCATTPLSTKAATNSPISSAIPSGQTYTGTQEISLNCIDQFGENCKNIFYLIDNEGTSESYSVYSGPIQISESSTLRFFGIDVNEVVSSPKSEIYTINNPTNSTDTLVQFSSTNYIVNEDIAAAQIVVSRTGDTSQSISVLYEATADINGAIPATENADFTSITGVLNWEANDATNRTFYVPIKGDAVTESVETIALNLSGNSTNIPTGSLTTSRISINDSVCLNTLSENITVDTVITAPCSQVTNQINVRNNANLTLAPGITLVFENGAGISVNTDGSFTSEGTQAKPILLTGLDRSRGYWHGVSFVRSNNTRNSLNYTTIEFGAGGIGSNKANLHIHGDSASIERIKITNSTFSDGSDYGIVLSPNTIAESFTNNQVTRNQLGSIHLPANVMHYLDGASRYTGNDRDYIDVTPGKITDSQSWDKFDTPLFVEGLNISADLTLSSGTELIFDDGDVLQVNTDGSLNAIGTEEQPILFTSFSQTPGAWQGLRFIRSNDIKNVLDFVTVEYGGASSSLGSGNLVLHGDSASTQRLKLTNSILRYSSNNGFEFAVNSDISGFSNNTISNNDGQTGKIAIASVAYLDAESDYSNNNLDYIEFIGKNINEDQHWKKLNAEYLSDGISLNANLDLEPGIILHFKDNKELSVNTTGSLTAIGTQDDPIIFTNDSESPGSWDGIRFIRSDNINNKLSNIEVHYAGKSNILGDGAISLYGDSATSSNVDIRDSLITNSANYPIWLHRRAVINDDVNTSNEFTNNAFNSIFRVSP